MDLTEYGRPDGCSDSCCKSCHSKPGDENICFFLPEILYFKEKVLSRQSYEAFRSQSNASKSRLASFFFFFFSPLELRLMKAIISRSGLSGRVLK